MILTLVGREAADAGPRPGARRSSGICSAPRSRSHHRAPTTRAVRSPSRAAAQVDGGRCRRGRTVAPTAASCQAGDAERVQQLLGGQQAGVHVLVGWSSGSSRPTSVHRALVQRAGRGAVGVALDPAVAPGRGCRRRCRRSSSAAVLTQAPWPSRLVRKTGRSGTTASSSCRVGVPPGKNSIDQPPPTIHSSVGVRGGVLGDDVEALAAPTSVPCRSHCSIARPPITGWTCASWKPGSSSPPARSTTSVSGPASSASSSSGPMAAIRPAGDGDALRGPGRPRRGGTPIRR